MTESDRLGDIDAFILDLDGVVTDTASLHAKAWKQTFDRFLESRKGRAGENLRPFDLDRDYRRCVDGKPRYDGVRSFLAARGIELDEGRPADDVERETVHGLGNRKNVLFHDLLEEDGVDVYRDAVEAVRRWKRAGRKVAVVSSSRNCGEVLDAANLAELFDERVDGVTLEKAGLSGKPEPDAFIEAARRLDVTPDRTAVFEDAIAGVEAGRAGGFALVVAVDRPGKSETELREHGADLVVQSFDEIDPDASDRLRSKGECLDEVRRRLRHKSGPSLFLDYDGTLTPIVPNPADAHLSVSMRNVLESLAAKLPVVIVSGRDREDVARRVDLSSVFYAGSHGFDISGPDGFRKEHDDGKRFLPLLDEAEAELEKRLSASRVERKRYAIAVHYRDLSEEDVPGVERIVKDVATQFSELRWTGGKKIFELRPAVDWDKGRAVLWLVDAFGLSTESMLCIYIGDDVTDEDAFRALADTGFGIQVGGSSTMSFAHGRLEDVGEVESFLSDLIHLQEPIR